MKITVELPAPVACALVRKAVGENRPLYMQAEVEIARAMQRFALREARATARQEVAGGTE